MKGELRRRMIEMAVTSVNALSYNLPGRNDKYHELPHTR
jgi:hypothetical protein